MFDMTSHTFEVVSTLDQGPVSLLLRCGISGLHSQRLTERLYFFPPHPMKGEYSDNKGRRPPAKDARSTIDDIIAFENGQLSEEDTIAMFQAMIDDGSVWKMQGSYGRTAMDLIESGLCMLGPTGHRNYYGNYVPSRGEVKPGTKGSPEYCRKRSSSH